MQMIISCHFFIGCFSKMCHRVHLNRLLCFRLFNRSAVNCFVYLVIEQLWWRSWWRWRWTVRRSLPSQSVFKRLSRRKETSVNSINSLVSILVRLWNSMLSFADFSGRWKSVLLIFGVDFCLLRTFHCFQAIKSLLLVYFLRFDFCANFSWVFLLSSEQCSWSSPRAVPWETFRPTIEQSSAPSHVARWTWVRVGHSPTHWGARFTWEKTQRCREHSEGFSILCSLFTIIFIIIFYFNLFLCVQKTHME